MRLILGLVAAFVVVLLGIGIALTFSDHSGRYQTGCIDRITHTQVDSRYCALSVGQGYGAYINGVPVTPHPATKHPTPTPTSIRNGLQPTGVETVTGRNDGTTPATKTVTKTVQVPSGVKIPPIPPVKVPVLTPPNLKLPLPSISIPKVVVPPLPKV